jgi:hypothetical protein
VVEGRRAEERDAVLRFGDGRVAVVATAGGASLGSIAYADITGAGYTRAKHPKWWPTLAGPAVDVDLPGGLFTGDRHWLALQSRGAYLIVRLNDQDYRQVMALVTERTGRPVERMP